MTPPYPSNQAPVEDAGIEPGADDETFAFDDVLVIDAPAALEKAADALRAGMVELAVCLTYQATRKMGLMRAEERPDELGRAMLDVMAPQARAIVLHGYITERGRLLKAGAAEQEAGDRASRSVADVLGIPFIEPEHFSAVLFARRWWLMQWLPINAWQALDAIMSRDKASCEDVLTRALCTMLDAPAAPPAAP